ncbi:protein kinase domain-containing protein [Nannocystis pusilla]|uniref:serine/threonine protein kinase n=1 Tax=Nannocystis pusilla TaxID=889268 RepID=UPI003BF2C73A
MTDASEARAKVGDVLGERWELRGPAGGGSLGQVFLAWDRERRQTCALKLFDPAAVSSEAFRRYGEALRSAAAVSHPAVVLPQTPVVAGGPRFAVGEWVAGADLDTLRASGGPLQWTRAAEIVSTCADALAAVHEATGLAHRALKPGNVRITESSQVRLLDLGIAEIAVSPVAPRPGGAFVDYRAPEQIEGQAGDARSDVFTLAVLLFEATTGVHPFTAPSAFKAAHRALQSTPDLSTAGLPAQARPLLTRALARRPEERHANAREFLRALTLVRQSVGGMAPRANAGDNATTAEPADEPAPVADPTTQLRIPVVRPKPPVAAPEPPARGPHRDAAFVAPVAPATADSPPAADEPELLGSGADRPIPAQPPKASKPARESLQQLDTGRLVTPEPSTERDARRPASPEPTMELREPARASRRSGAAERDPRQAAPKAARTRPEPNTVPAPQDLPAEWTTTERDFRRPSPPREATVALPLSGELSEKPGRRTAQATHRPPAESTVALPPSGDMSSRPGTTIPERRRPSDKTQPQAESDDPSRQPALPADWTTTARDGRRLAAPETTMALAHDDGLTEGSGLPADWTTTERDGRRPAESTMALPDPGAHEDAATTAMTTLRPRSKQPVPEDTSDDPGGEERTRALPRMTGRAQTELRPESTVVLDQDGARPAESTLALPDPKDIPARATPREESTRVVSNAGDQARAMRTQRPAGTATPAPATPPPADKPWLSPRGLMFFNIGLGVLIITALVVLLTR